MRRTAGSLVAQRPQHAAAASPGSLRVHPPNTLGRRRGFRVDGGARMSLDNADISDDVLRLIDSYLAGELDEAGITELDGVLRGSAAARAYFVRFCKLETDLH